MVKMLVFDMDGTLTPSRMKIHPEMTEKLLQTLEHFRVAILTGWGITNIQKQVLNHLPDSPLLENLFLAPNSGTSLYVRHDPAWWKVYEHIIPQDIRTQLIAVCRQAMHELELMPEKVYGDLIVDYQSQVSLCILGNEAPCDLKKVIDADRKKRQLLVQHLKERIPECEYKIAGGSTIDITHAGWDKYTGIQQLAELAGIREHEMLFVGDSVYPQGNDFAPFEHGIRSKPVHNEEETLQFLEKILKDPQGFFQNKFYKKRQPNTIPKDMVRHGVCMKSVKPQPEYVLRRPQLHPDALLPERKKDGQRQRRNILSRFFGFRRTVPA